MDTDQRKGVRVLEVGHANERLALTVACCAVVAECSLVNILMAVGAGVGQSQEPCLPRREQLHSGVGVTALAGGVLMFSSQSKLESGMSEQSHVGNSHLVECQGADELKLLTMVFRVAQRALGDIDVSQLAVQSRLLFDLTRDRFVTRQAGGRHRLAVGPMTVPAAFAPRQSRVLGVHGGKGTGRDLVAVRMPSPQHQRERKHAHGYRIQPGFGRRSQGMRLE